MQTGLEKKIKNARLTKTERIVAEYLVNNIPSICFMTATDVAARIGSSDSSVIRLCRTLGYKGYQDLQKDIQRQMVEHMGSSQEEISSPMEKLVRNMADLQESDLLKNHLELASNNVKSVLGKNSREKIDAVAATLIGSRKKYVVGYRGCRGIADWMALLLGHMLPRVILNTHADSSAVETLLDMTSDDCLVVISFHRYAKMAQEMAGLARSRKSKLIVITDKITSPVASGADHVLLADVDSLTFFNSHVGTMFLVELILLSISRNIGANNQDRLELMERYITLCDFF